ncbi:MAG: anaerobic ribonucleoside-triphosphate reductase activating protein [Candidatus Diapherotrites archaeon]|uniref:Anaerobic ribonucleoside-triphosphate reductase activating protein n=1 Tax=Candidatus Iainarchaeum sp. TaxID=3101447 RepID=A0A7K4BZS2_9ARCH|nr:anaerobic ribonucleoside-triphosphate reductase activating protein [Candidatus Diapherotrites archaeon]
MFIGGLQELTLTDFPDKVACIVFLVNCNFKCKFCYNKELTSTSFFKKSKRKLIPDNDFFLFLDSKKKMLDGVVITGGEPTLSPGLVEFVKKIKQKGFLVKLDTNGSNPVVLEKLLKKNLVDYVAMDLKSPEKKHKFITQSSVPFSKIKESIFILKNSGVLHEFRTTLYPRLSIEDLKEMSELIVGERWFLQQFVGKNVLDKNSRHLRAFNNKKLEKILKELNKITKVSVRGY